MNVFQIHLLESLKKRLMSIERRGGGGFTNIDNNIEGCQNNRRTRRLHCNDLLPLIDGPGVTLDNIRLTLHVL